MLKVDGDVVATQTMARTVPLILQWDETFDIGADTGTPVDDHDYQVPFAFTGKIDKLTISVEPPILDAGRREAAQRSLSKRRRTGGSGRAAVPARRRAQSAADAQVPMASGLVSFFNAATTASGVSRPVFGFSAEGTFSICIERRAASASTSIR